MEAVLKSEQVELSELRKEKGLSQKALAQELGVNRVTISNYENGLRTPRLKDAMIIARLFNTSVENISFANKDANRRKVVEWYAGTWEGNNKAGSERA